MKYRNLATYLGFLLFSVSNSCVKSVEPIPSASLPPITTEGKNTFGCTINGQLWLPKGAFPIPSFNCDFSGGLLLIEAHKALEEEAIKINLPISSSGSLEIIGQPSQIVFYMKGTSPFFFADSIIKGNITILRLDSISRIVSGTFYFDAVDSAKIARYEIRDGRFDLKY